MNLHLWVNLDIEIQLVCHAGPTQGNTSKVTYGNNYKLIKHQVVVCAKTPIFFNSHAKVQVWVATFDRDRDLLLFRDLQILTPIPIYGTDTISLNPLILYVE